MLKHAEATRMCFMQHTPALRRAENLRRANNDSFPEENRHALLPLFQRIRSSFLIIETHERGRLGYGLYVPITGLKHSCRPNASYVFKGKKLEVRALKDIANGEEVSIDLIDIMQPTARRQEDLARLKGIVCDCERCGEAEQEEEMAKLADNEAYRELFFAPLCRPVPHWMIPRTQVVPSPRSVFDGFTSLMDFKAKYQGSYHPEFVYSMYRAAMAAPDMPDKTVGDKEKFDQMVEKLKKAIPLSYGHDDEVVSMQELLLRIGKCDWSNLLP